MAEWAMAGIEHAVSLSGPAPPVLAMGAWFKNTLCITSGQQAFISQDIGNLDTADACCAHERMARALLALGEKPCAIAHDMHPDFHSTRFAAALAGELDIPLIPVQHHHAHVAAVCAEHGVSSTVLGLALDGVGLGTDGTPWGGELLRVDGAGFQRLGHLRRLPMPGGDRAAREPWRMAASVLHELGRGGEIVQRFREEPAAATVEAMLQRRFNAPLTSSAGRLFDAAAGLLGICARSRFEAQAAMELEKLAQGREPAAPLAGGYRIAGNFELDFLPLLAVLADCTDAAHGAALFHATLAAGLEDWVGRAAAEQSIETVVLGGGCFLNTMLSQALEASASARGLRVRSARRLPPGDGAISLGQAWVAVRRLDLERGN